MTRPSESGGEPPGANLACKERGSKAEAVAGPQAGAARTRDRLKRGGMHRSDEADISQISRRLLLPYASPGHGARLRVGHS